MYNIELERYNLIMVILILIISNIVINYSLWYMEEDNNRNKFIMLLIIFTISMLFFILSGNYFNMFIGWEYIGLLSFLLINYWYINFNNTKSALKAIIFNKIRRFFLYYFYIFIF
jgi:NADH:ubiquinone oxidoreductase subunit 5 (subunit L)/multisubunit Na+/H+ antiporter MnhA subunit